MYFRDYSSERSEHYCSITRCISMMNRLASPKNRKVYTTKHYIAYLPRICFKFQKSLACFEDLETTYCPSFKGLKEWQRA